MARVRRPPGRTDITTVATHAGVSRQTVSNALNKPERLHPDTLARVLSSIEQLGYRPNQAARSLRTQTSRLIGCRLLSVAPTSTGGVIDRFMHSLCAAARESHYDVLAFAVDDEEAELATFRDLMRRNAVDGFVLTGTHPGDVRADWLLVSGAEFVAFGRPWDSDHLQHSWVDIDGAAGTSACVDHLADQDARRIGFVGWPSGSGVGDDRYAGWRAATRRRGLPTSGLTVRGQDGIETGETLAGRLLDRPGGVDAIVCVSDPMAIGAIRAIEVRGLLVGAQVAVTGFDDSPAAAVVRPGLTSVRQPLELAAQRIVELLAGHLTRSLQAPVTDLLEPALVLRASSQKRGPDPGGARSRKGRQ
ncbi:MAG: LacI family DNA-binding transcriptional regulator [Nocardioidaceae bacterium]